MRSMHTARDNTVRIHYGYSYCTTNVAKQYPQEGTVVWYLIPNSCLKLNVRHRAAIIFVSPLLVMEPLTKDIGAFDVAMIVVSLDNSVPWLYIGFGAAKWTTWPSNNSSMLFHGSAIGNHLKSFKKTTFLSSTPSHA